MILRYLLAVLLLGGGIAHAQTRLLIRLDDAGPGRGPDMLSSALKGPFTVIAPGTGQATLRADTTYGETVIVLARDAVVDGSVTGDVIVIGGDLHVHPRAAISGRAIAIGGGVYESALSHVGGGISPFHDFTYDFTEVSGGYALRYRSLVDRPDAVFSWRGFYGFGIPEYDRSNGLSVSVGPIIAVPNAEILLEPRVTYRSNLGVVDPRLDATYVLDSRTTLRASGARETFSNDDWIWPDWLNSLSTLVAGHDTRNYFRATRAEATLARRWESATTQIEPYVGGRWERAHSVGPATGATGGPWSVLDRRSVDDILRPNPRVDDGTIASGLAGAQLDWSSEAAIARVNLDAEVGALRPIASTPSAENRTFGQVTFDGTITFPTFGLQTLRFDVHAVGSAGDRAPRQRWAYLGGPGSVPTLDMLERGGDQLIYVDGRYNIPIEQVMLPYVGSPILTLREVLAGADVGRWPGIAQSTGARLALSIAYIEFMVDPVSRRNNFSFGLSLAR